MPNTLPHDFANRQVPLQTYATEPKCPIKQLVPCHLKYNIKKNKNKNKQALTKGFTPVKLMVVILIIGILAAVAIPLMQVRIDRSKWSEECSTAGTIRTSIRSYAAETSIATAQGLVGNDLGDVATEVALGFIPTDLEGTYFTAADYTITAVNGDGIATITATGGSKADSPTGTYVLQAEGKWVKM